MAKYTKYQKLPQDKKQEVILELCHAISMVKTMPDVAKLLGDLFSEQEVQMIGKRLQIAKMLLQDKRYEDIKEELKVSQPTIARVNLWLQQGGDGFRMLMKMGLGKKKITIPAWKPPSTAGQSWDSWAYIKRRYPLYFLPQLLIEDIIRAANNKQRKRLLETLATLRKAGKGKKEVFRHIEQILLAERSGGRQRLDKEGREVVLDSHDLRKRRTKP